MLRSGSVANSLGAWISGACWRIPPSLNSSIVRTCATDEPLPESRAPAKLLCRADSALTPTSVRDIQNGSETVAGFPSSPRSLFRAGIHVFHAGQFFVCKEGPVLSQVFDH